MRTINQLRTLAVCHYRNETSNFESLEVRQDVGAKLQLFELDSASDNFSDMVSQNSEATYVCRFKKCHLYNNSAKDRHIRKVQSSYVHSWAITTIDLVDGTFWPLKMRPRHLVTEKTVILHYLREKEKWIWRPQFKSSCHDFLSWHTTFCKE